MQEGSEERISKQGELNASLASCSTASTAAMMTSGRPSRRVAAGQGKVSATITPAGDGGRNTKDRGESETENTTTSTDTAARRTNGHYVARIIERKPGFGKTTGKSLLQSDSHRAENAVSRPWLQLHESQSIAGRPASLAAKIHSECMQLRRAAVNQANFPPPILVRKPRVWSVYNSRSFVRSLFRPFPSCVQRA